jgi:DNA processing protein
MAFAGVRGINRSLAQDLLSKLGSEREFFTASETQLRYITQSRARIYSTAYRKELLERAAAEERFLQANNVTATYFTSPDYPTRLTECDDAPLMLYTLGNLNLNTARTVGIVGTRHATAYGIDFTRRLVDDLAATVDNVVIVSGLAYGIDVAAHRAALQAKVPTVAVMATGMNSIYPADHRGVAADMVRHGGMLITEYSSTEPIHKGNFVARNRIVAGLCDCLVVAESAEKGGALITANLAAGYNRDVFAVPGRITDQYSMGCNRLIAANLAGLVRSAADLCEAMSWPMREASAAASQLPTLPMPLNPDEELIVNYLAENEDASLSSITAATGFAVGKLMSMLIDMEFRGLLLALPGARYRKV